MNQGPKLIENRKTIKAGLFGIGIAFMAFSPMVSGWTMPMLSVGVCFLALAGFYGRKSATH